MKNKVNIKQSTNMVQRKTQEKLKNSLEYMLIKYNISKFVG